MRICFHRTPSAISANPGCVVHRNDTPGAHLLPRLCWISRQITEHDTGSLHRVSLPASIFEMSRVLSRIDMMWVQHERIVVDRPAVDGSLVPVAIICSAYPMIPFIGLRI